MPKAIKNSKSSQIFKIKTQLSHQEHESLLNTLEERFEKNMHRHKNVIWTDVVKKLESQPKKIVSLFAMEQTGGEPDVINILNDNSLTFVDCSTESPKRRSLCYDQQALDCRKEFKPVDSAVNLAEKMGINLLNEEQYRKLQDFGEFDTKTSSWIETPSEIRKLGGAIFADRRYNNVFVYHNGAESYYASRGFRGYLKL